MPDQAMKAEAEIDKSDWVPGWNRDGTRSTVLVPPPPPIRVVTKGWWVMREERVPFAEVLRMNREEEEKERRRSRCK